MYKVGDWVMYIGYGNLVSNQLYRVAPGTGDNGTDVVTNRTMGDVVPNKTCGIVIDYIGGGPECSPCIVVAWQVKCRTGWPYMWWRVSKHEPSQIKQYVVGR